MLPLFCAVAKKICKKVLILESWKNEETFSSGAAKSFIQKICVYLAGAAPRIFRRGADSSYEGAKIRFSEYYECQESPKNSFSPSEMGDSMFWWGL